MGFVSFAEDIADRYYEDTKDLHDWSQYARRSATPREVAEATDLFGDPFERTRRIIVEFFEFYRDNRPETTRGNQSWQQHFRYVQGLHALLAPVAGLREDAEATWNALRTIEAELHRFGQAAPLYGPMSRQSIARMNHAANVIRTRCTRIERDLQRFLASAQAMAGHDAEKAEVRQSVEMLVKIRKHLDTDLDARRQLDRLAVEVTRWWERFLMLHAVLRIQLNHRPVLKDLSRLALDEGQERYVARDYRGEFRLQGTAGSGKTVILIHRALRLAIENPDSRLCLKTVTSCTA